MNNYPDGDMMPDNPASPHYEPKSDESGMTKAERLRDERIDNQALEQLEDEK